MAASGEELLGFFACHCRGVKFYDLVDVCAEMCSKVVFRRDPHNRWDSNCVEVFLADRRGVKLGHIAREAAEWLSPLLLGPFRITGRIFSQPYSRALDGNRNWRYRVVDLHIFISGSAFHLEGLKDSLDGAFGILDGLVFGPVTMKELTTGEGVEDSRVTDMDNTTNDYDSDETCLPDDYDSDETCVLDDYDC